MLSVEMGAGHQGELRCLRWTVIIDLSDIKTSPHHVVHPCYADLLLQDRKNLKLYLKVRRPRLIH